MCGIVGLIGNCAEDLFRRQAALESIKHRGPNSHGESSVSIFQTPIWLGHTRLSILDLSAAGHQPIHSQDGRWLLTFNGEIYNHLELRRQLDIQWRGHSDTETLAEAIAAWGVEATLSRLNGMFAFGALDRVDGKLYLARDPFGVKPVYFSAGGGADFAFASEIRALVAGCGKTTEIDQTGLQTFLTLRYVPSPHTLFNGVSRLQPGHLLTYSIPSKCIEIKSYAPSVHERFNGNVDDAIHEYQEILRAAVRRQLLSDVPVGLLLSGGIDSALIAAFAAEQGATLPCFTVGFGEDFAECEISDAAETARVLGFPFHPVTVTSESIWQAFEASVRSVEEPLGTTSILPMWDLIERARRDVTVVLTGQGSDEPWGGYRRYQGEVWRQRIPFPWLVNAAKPIVSLWRGMPEYLVRAIQSTPISTRAARFEAAYALFTGVERKELYGNSHSGYALDSIRYWLDWSRHANGSSAEPMMAIDARMGLADDLLLYGDKISMAHSLEARVPMLDIELVRFVESLPLDYRVTLNKTKIVHKLAASTYLPPEIVNRRKKGFQVPFSRWVRNEWKKRVEALLLDSAGVHLCYLSREAIQQTWNEHQRGLRDRGKQLFALASFAFWCRNWSSNDG